MRSYVDVDVYKDENFIPTAVCVCSNRKCRKNTVRTLAYLSSTLSNFSSTFILPDIQYPLVIVFLLFALSCSIQQQSVRLDQEEKTERIKKKYQNRRAQKNMVKWLEDI